VAWFWRLDPFDVMAMPAEDVELLEDQASRIMANLQRD
jgi:hypothetical protein